MGDPANVATLSRTRWAELHVENFISPAFVSEFVFRSPQVQDGAIQREVADLLITRAEQALLISQKCQEDPGARPPKQLLTWAQKRAAGAVSQLKGALRRVGIDQEIWCDHPRRGRVSFPNGLPHISHAIAAIEVFEPVGLQPDLPIENQGTPISYLSVSDFLNLSQQLRTVPEFVRYLDARRALPAHELRTLGAEEILFRYYLMFDGSFKNFTTRSEALRVLEARGDEVSEAVAAHIERHRYSALLEHVADQLAGRHPNYRDGLSKAVLDRYEPSGRRHTYLRIQELLAGWQLAERAEIGRMFEKAAQKRNAQGGTGFTFAAAMVTSHPDWVFVVGSFGECPRFSRDKLLSAFEPLTRAAMVHFARTRCLLIVDRDGVSYEVGLNERVAPL